MSTIGELQKQLNAYKEALQRDNDPKWESYIGELADGLISYTKTVEAYIASSPTWEANKQMIENAARQLRYMATDFTNKANFVPMRMDLEAVKKVCCFSNGELRYVKNPGSGLYWCHTHNRAAEWIRLPLGIEEPMHVCDPNLGGITMPCRVAKRL